MKVQLLSFDGNLPLPDNAMHPIANSRINTISRICPPNSGHSSKYRVDAGHQRGQLLRALDRAKPQAKMPHASYLRNARQMYERGVR